MTKAPIATILISTRDRSDDLRRCLASCVSLNGHIEVLVISDGSRDCTPRMVREEFPQVRLIVEDESAGLIARRNQGVLLATAEIIVSLDDDAEFSDEDTVVQVIAAFERTRAGLLALPYVDTKYSDEVLQRGVSDDEPTGSFRGTAFAVQRAAFVAAGGFEETLVRQGEERDLAIRMIEAGWGMHYGTSAPILHHESRRRDFSDMDYYGRRNDILFGWWNLPWRLLVPYTFRMIVRSVLFGIRVRRPQAMLRGTIAGFWACCATPRPRRPVSQETVLEFRRLTGGGF